MTNRVIEAELVNQDNPKLMSRRQLLTGLAAGTVVAVVPACSENPVTGRSQFVLVSDDALAQAAQASWSQLRREQRVSRDPRLNSALSRVGDRIVRVSGLTRLDWEYTVFDSDQRNAFVLPGGKVGFYTGIMKLMDDDDQIAVVMGHEVGHILGRHAAERYSQATASNTALQLGAVALQAGDVGFSREIAAILGAGVQYGIILPYSRRHELEADEVGIKLMHRAGYNVNQAIPFWEKMRAANSGGRPPEFLSTHPNEDSRIALIQRTIRSLPPR